MCCVCKKKMPGGSECFFLFLFGHPGCEQKALVADELVSRCPIPYVSHVSVGRWLKAQAAAPHTDLGAYCMCNWNDDALDAIAAEYVEMVCADFANQAAVIAAALSARHTPLALIVSGYPRTQKQAEKLAHVCRGHYMFAVEFSPPAIYPTTTTKRQTAVHEELASRCCLWRVFNNDGSSTQAIAEQLCADTEQWLSDQPRHMVRLMISPEAPARVNGVFTLAGAIQAAQVIQLALRLANATRTQRHFCGSQPISLLREHVGRLQRYAYMVSLKADGERYLCVVHESSLWFVSRSLHVYRSVYRPALAAHNGTLLDGEYVHASGLFIVLDCLAVQGRNIVMQPLMERLEASVPVGLLFADASHQPWFRPQEYVVFSADRLGQLLAKRAERPFALDGMVFTPAKLPYRLGIDFNMFKWKVAEENTVDLLYLRGTLFCRQTRRGLSANNNNNIAEDEVDYVERSQKNLCPIGKLVDDGTDLRQYDGCVLECQLVHGNFADADSYVWRCKRVRPDKRGANLDWICASIVHSIRENITLADLLAVAARLAAPSL